MFTSETVSDMEGSYIMMLPDGRFFNNFCGRYSYGSNTIFEVGVERALYEVGWDPEKFLKRGGVYNWKGKERNQHLPKWIK